MWRDESCFPFLNNKMVQGDAAPTHDATVLLLNITFSHFQTSLFVVVILHISAC